MFAFMGWSRDLAERAAAPAYPCLIDERHSLGETYGIVNVPTAVWIDEQGTIVRPPEAPGSTRNRVGPSGACAGISSTLATWAQGTR